MDYKDYYKILEIDKKATPAEVKKAYRTLAKKNHPDKNIGNKKAEDLFKSINEANEILGNPEKRKQYDELGKNWQQNPQQQYQQRNPNHQDRKGNQGFDGSNKEEDFLDFFKQFFEQQRSSKRQESQAKKGDDYETELEISLQEAYSGTSRIIHLENEKLRITTKPGSYNDQRLRIKNKGGKGGSEGHNGDLFVKIRVADNAKIFLKGDDLYQTTNINLYDAILGNDLIIETLSGKLKIKIPAGTQNEKKFKLKGKGMPAYEKEDVFGDFYLTILIHIPEKLTDKQKVIFEELRAIS